MYPVSDSLDSEVVGVTIIRHVLASEASGAFSSQARPPLTRLTLTETDTDLCALDSFAG